MSARATGCIDRWASMDNSPRNTFLKGGGSAIDTSSQMVLFGRNLATIAEALGKASEGRGMPMRPTSLARRSMP